MRTRIRIKIRMRMGMRMRVWMRMRVKMRWRMKMGMRNDNKKWIIMMSVKDQCLHWLVKK